MTAILMPVFSIGTFGRWWWLVCVCELVATEKCASWIDGCEMCVRTNVDHQQQQVATLRTRSASTLRTVRRRCSVHCVVRTYVRQNNSGRMINERIIQPTNQPVDDKQQD